MTDEAAIRKLITHWPTAVPVGDLYSVLAEHDPDIVIFDVPPPYQGLRGLAGRWVVTHEHDSSCSTE